MYAKIVLITAAILLSGQVYAQSTTAPKASSTAKKKAAAKASTTAPTAPVVVEVKKEEVKAVEPVVAAAPEQTTGQKVLSYMKEKFSVSYHGEFYFLRRCNADCSNLVEDEKDVQDLKTLHSPTLIYKPIKDIQFLATAEFKYSDKDNDGTYRNGFYRSLFTLTKKNILTEKVNGVTLDAGIGRRQFYTGGTPDYSSYGNNRVFSTVSKTFGKHNGSLFVQYLHNDYKHPVATTWEHGIELLPTINLQLTEKLTWLINDDIVINTSKLDNNARDFYISHEMNIAYINYQWTDKLGTYYQQKYYHTEDFTKDPGSVDDFFEYYIGASYSFTPKATVTAEVGSEMFHARDGKDFFAKKMKFPEFALYVDVAF